jgi:hypothetical protein
MLLKKALAVTCILPNPAKTSPQLLRWEHNLPVNVFCAPGFFSRIPFWVRPKGEAKTDAFLPRE